MTDAATGTAATPLQDHLRSIPRDAIYQWVTPEADRELWQFSSNSVPVGLWAHEAADLLDRAALATREDAPDWTARTEAAWAENNREEAPADHVSDARQMVEAPAEAGESLCRLSALLSASHLAGDAAVAGLGAVCWNDLRAVLDVALRAQAQAREGECQ